MFQRILKKIGLYNLRGVKVICIGSSAKDLFFPTSEGDIFDTPNDILSQRKIAFELGAKYQVDDRAESLGGCATNVSVGLARLGIDVSCYTKVGDDSIGEWIVREMKKNGVSTSHVIIEERCKSDLSTIIVDTKSGERVIFFNRDANEKLNINEELLVGADWVFLSALNGKWEENMHKIISACDNNELKIAFNPGQRNIKDNVGIILDIIKKTDILMLNKDEAIEILSSGTLTFENDKANNEAYLIREMAKICKGAITLTDGQRGCWFISNDKIFHAPAVISHAVDSTGAGDSFTSAFLGSFVKNISIDECVKRGIINSSNVVKYFGAIDGLLNERDILEKIKSVSIEEII